MKQQLYQNSYKTTTIRRLAIACCIFVLLLFCMGLPAQNFQSKFGSISYRDGIEGHAPHTSMISTDGRLWIYTEKQLNCYDGYTVKAFSSDSPPAVAKINGLLLEAPDGTIWAGSYQHARQKQLLFGEKFEIKVLGPEEELTDFNTFYKSQLPFHTNDIINVCSNGVPGAPIYVITNKHKIFRYDEAGFHEVLEHNSGQLINTVYPVSDGTYLIGRPGKIEQEDRWGAILNTYQVPIAPMQIIQAGPNIYSLLFLPEITYNGELCRHLMLYLGQGVKPYLEVSNDNQIDITQAVMVKLQKGRLWHIVSRKDWQVIDQETKQSFSFKEAYPEEVNGYIINNYPQELYFDEEGVAYATLYSKVLALKISSLPFRKLFTEEGLNSMRSFVPYREDTILLSAYSGLWGYNPVSHDTYRINRAADQVWLDALQLAPDTILTCSHNSRLNLVDGAGRVYRQVYLPKPFGSFLSVHSLLEDTSGRIWVGTAAGLAEYHRGDTLYDHCADINTTGALGNASIRHLVEYQNRIWIATNKGLYSMEADTRAVQHHLDGDTIVSLNYLYWAAPDTCWMATNGSGLWRWTPSDGALRKYNRETAGLPNDVHHAVFTDGSGRLWIPSNDGLIWFMPGTGDFGTFTRQSGLPDNEFNYNAHLRLPDGRLLLGGVAGAVVFHPDSLLLGQEQNVSLNLVYFGVPDKKTGLLQDRTAQWHQTQRIDFSPLTNIACHLKVHVASYLPLKNHQYDYRIDGQHDSWIPMSSNELVIGGLPYGEYQLRIRGRTTTYSHRSNELRIPIVVHRPYYEKWYFWLLVGVGTFGVGFLLFRFRLRQLRFSEKRLRREVERRTKTIEQDRQTILRQNAELEQLNEGKDKVMSIIGHEIRGNLFFIGSATRQILQTLKSEDYDSAAALSQNIHLAALRMEGAIENLTRWASLQNGKMVVRKSDVELSPLLQHLVRAHQPEADRKGIILSVEDSGSLTVFADSNAMSICLQNLLRNALKFTDQGGEVVVSCYKQGGNAHIEVKDSGIGMTPETIDRVTSNTLTQSQVGTSGEVGTGLGLNITRELIEKQSGSIAFESEVGIGTTVIITLPLHKKATPGSSPPNTL
ncbi:MAG: ATP-binding protein [Phaeodactylibacter sp.]|uniref:sensor histidine kinase n=1 Tax=Phaeodactylibacter sp. TaxID=1940289 RepID=UPI0032EC0B5F